MPAKYRLLRSAVPPPAPLILDDEQQRVADHAGGPLLVLAGPGTGKTATLVETVARRVERGADPLSLLLLTFSRRAAAELRERLALRLGGRAVSPTAWTFHAFCLALLTEHRAGTPSPAPRLLTGPEQDAVIRDLLRGDLADRRPWPEPLAGVLDTRGLTEEIRAMLARIQQLGFSAADLAVVSGGRPDWQAVARFYESYQESLEAQGLLDYTELVARAAKIADEPASTSRLRARYSAVWVDEYQDTDPLQERLLQAIAGDGRDLTVVGDPDQAIYAFRGADVRGIAQFPERFRTRAGERAPTQALATCRRSGPAIVAAGRRIAARIPAMPGFSHRDLLPTGQSVPPEVVTLATEGAEAEWIADVLRRAHLDDGVEWSSMAVLVRSGSSIPLLRRAFATMGVPAQVAADEVPLAAEPAVAPLLLLLRCAHTPALLTEERVRELLISPLVGADAGELRRLGRALRGAARDADGTAAPAPSAMLIAAAIAGPRHLDAVPMRDARTARRLVGLLGAAREVLDRGGSPADALWSVWAASPWRHRLEAYAGGRGRDARAADSDLDAVVALFDAVARAQEQRPGIQVTALLETLAAQQIPAGPQEERGWSREGVRLLTAHRSKGLEWDLVVVAHVQEGSWPDVRPRGSLLDPDRLGPAGLQPPVDRRALLADERRLFYVACTRARHRLLVTAVESVSEDGERPSRFLGDVGVEVLHQAPRPLRPRTLAGVVAALRYEAVDPALSSEVRGAAAHRLALLAAARDGTGQPLVPAAAPEAWWGLAPRTQGEHYDPMRPLPLSASTLSALERCPLAWLLRHEAHGSEPATVALGFGKAIHALAELVASGRLPADGAVLGAELDRVWASLGYDVPWQQANERRLAQLALERFVTYSTADRGRQLLAAEVSFDHEVETANGPVRLRGRLDRVERDAADRVVVVDLKTTKNKPTAKEIAADKQLALYQYVVESGSLPILPPGMRSGGAELWQLRDGDGPRPAIQAQSSTSEHGPLLDTIAAARALVLEGRFDATPHDGCRRCAFRSCCPAHDEGRGVVR